MNEGVRKLTISRKGERQGQDKAMKIIDLGWPCKSLTS